MIEKNIRLNEKEAQTLSQVKQRNYRIVQDSTDFKAILRRD